MFLSMSQVDKLLDLKRGTANYFRLRGLFQAVQAGRAWVIDEEDLPQISEAIWDHIHPEDNLVEYMTSREAAKRCGVAITTIYNQVRNLRIIGVKRGKRLFISVNSLEKYRLNRLPPGVDARLRRKRR